MQYHVFHHLLFDTSPAAIYNHYTKTAFDMLAHQFSINISHFIITSLAIFLLNCCNIKAFIPLNMIVRTFDVNWPLFIIIYFLDLYSLFTVQRLYFKIHLSITTIFNFPPLFNLIQLIIKKPPLNNFVCFLTMPKFHNFIFLPLIFAT